MAFQTILLKRGLKSNLPEHAATGEPLITLDTGELFIGQGQELPLMKVSANADFLGGKDKDYFQKKIKVVTENPALQDLEENDLIINISTVPAKFSIFNGTELVEIGNTQVTSEEVAFTPDGDLTSTTVQESIVELRNDTDSKLETLQINLTALINLKADKTYVDSANTAIQSAINAEQTARETADTQLQGNIDTLSNQIDTRIDNLTIQNLHNVKTLINGAGLKLDADGKVESFLTDMTPSYEVGSSNTGLIFTSGQDIPHNAESAFVHDTLDFYGATGLQSIGYQFSDEMPRQIFKYSVKNTTNSTYVAPKSFVLEGAVDKDHTFTVLDTQSELIWLSGEVKEFPLSAPANYAAYRISVTALCEEHSQFGIEQIELIGDGFTYLFNEKTDKGYVDQLIALVQDQIDNSNSAKADKDYVDTKDTQLQSNIDSEIAARQTADSDLQTSINSEQVARQAADSTLQTNIDTLNAVKADKTELTSSINTVQSEIDNLSSVKADKTYVDLADTAIRSEFAAADTTLQSHIDAETAARESADTQIRTDFAGADTQLQTNINNLRDELTNKISTAIDGLNYKYNIEKMVASTDEITSPVVDAVYLVGLGNLATATFQKYNGTAYAVLETLAKNDIFIDKDTNAEYVFNGTELINKSREVSHEMLQGLQGGADGDHQHLTSDQLTKLNALDTQSALQAKIDLKSDKTYVDSADAALQANITAEQTRALAQETAIRNEFSVADANLRAELEQADADIRADFSAVDTDIRAEFANADNLLRTEMANADASLQAQINSITSGGGDSIASLRTSLDSEISARQSADSTEATTRQNADTALSQRITSLETVIDGGTF